MVKLLHKIMHCNVGVVVYETHKYKASYWSSLVSLQITCSEEVYSV